MIAISLASGMWEVEQVVMIILNAMHECFSLKREYKKLRRTYAMLCVSHCYARSIFFPLGIGDAAIFLFSLIVLFATVDVQLISV